ncbi:MAG: GldG family protein [Clostridia bacterium]|nr:GldG family protein [Clostridia bacterium]
MNEKENKELEKEEKDISEKKSDKKAENESKAENNENSDSKDQKNKKDKKPAKELSPEKAAKKAEKKDRRALKARAFKRGWFSAALVAFFIAAVILLNLIASTLVDKVPSLVIDTTGSDNFGLSEQTLNYISNLKDDIKITVLAEEKDYKEGGEYFIQADSMLNDYANKSDKITIEFVDLSSNPTIVSEYPDESLSQYNIIVKSDKGYKYITQQDYFDVQIDYNTYQQYIAGSKIEEAVTSAILNVTLDEKPKVTFISDINDNDYSAFKSHLENNGFETEEVSPAVGKIPEDTKILVLYTPVTDLDSSYVDTIADFLNNDGNLGKELLYFPSEKLADLPNIDSLLEEWGVSVEKGYAIENDTNYMGQLTMGVYLFATNYTDQTYTANMKNSALPFCVIGGYANPINILDDSKAVSLFTLSDQSEVMYTVESADQPQYVESPNVVLGAAATKKDDNGTSDDTSDDKSSNIIVIGSSVAASKTLLESSVYGNSSYFTSMLNILCDRENVGVSIEPVSLESDALGITTAKIRILSTIFVFIIPVAVLVTGIVIFVKRRNL